MQADRLHGTTSLIKHFLHALFASMQKTPHFLKKYHLSYLFFYLLFTLSDSIGISSDIFLARLSFCILDFRARLLSLCCAMSTRAYFFWFRITAVYTKDPIRYKVEFHRIARCTWMCRIWNTFLINCLSTLSVIGYPFQYVYRGLPNVAAKFVRINWKIIKSFQN